MKIRFNARGSRKTYFVFGHGQRLCNQTLRGRDVKILCEDRVLRDY